MLLVALTCCSFIGTSGSALGRRRAGAGRDFPFAPQVHSFVVHSACRAADSRCIDHRAGWPITRALRIRGNSVQVVRSPTIRSMLLTQPRAPKPYWILCRGHLHAHDGSRTSPRSAPTPRSPPSVPRRAQRLRPARSTSATARTATAASTTQRASGTARWSLSTPAARCRHL